jgi:hypothetical protein
VFRFTTSSGKPGANQQSPGPTMRRRRRPQARSSIPLPEVKEGNSDADWNLWQDSVIAFDSRFQSLRDEVERGDPFEGIHSKTR